MTLRNALRLVLAGALACMISACWMSAKPLLTDKNASVVAFAGRYHGENGGEMVDFEIASTGSNAYTMTDGKDPISTRFLALGDGWYLMQYEVGDDNGQPPSYMFNLLDETDGGLLVYSADCDDTSGSFKGMKRDDQVCEFTRLDGLKAAALAFIERIEKNGPGDEPALLKRIEP